ncbi:unnamed protein product [marine sediment metagenome]|uniref:Uncharacterized protein n=1 Tax=marine sediment metagenome TaxID=412755 RepID=X1PJK9_9ZZZZ
MTEFLCFNHKYPLHTIVESTEFKKNIFGKVCRVEIGCRCPECKMRIVYSFKIHHYEGGKYG